jgi:hypothetical protein
MEVAVLQGGVEHRSRVVVSGRETVLEIEVPGGAPPTRATLDPDGWVLKGGR